MLKSVFIEYANSCTTRYWKFKERIIPKLLLKFSSFFFQKNLVLLRLWKKSIEICVYPFKVTEILLNLYCVSHAYKNCRFLWCFSHYDFSVTKIVFFSCFLTWHNIFFIEMFLCSDTLLKETDTWTRVENLFFFFLKLMLKTFKGKKLTVSDMWRYKYRNIIFMISFGEIHNYDNFV